MKYNEKVYYTTLKLIMLKAVSQVIPGVNVEIRHSVNHSLYCELKRIECITDEELKKIKEKMKNIIKADYPINLITANVEDIKRKAKNIVREDITRFINTTGWIPMREYEVNGYVDYFYEKLYPSTGAIYLFEVKRYSYGFIIQYPTSDEIRTLGEVALMPKLTEVQRDCKRWEERMDVSYIGSLNEKTLSGQIIELIRINEAVHEIKLEKIVNQIIENKKIKLVTIAGPSSSGKTTFSKKVELHLKAHGIFPTVISLDSYYIGRENVPLGEDGKKDFESIEALDLKLLNENLLGLINGEEIEIPEYDFISGERKKEGKKVRLHKKGIIVIEGIHGLNERLTLNIPRENKFKVYISCLTQLNIDMHNRIPTNEVRKIRRIVRDSLSRGTSAEGTLSMWDSVRRGEEKNIFKFQEEADAMFDSNLVYELAVLKPFAMKELIKIKIDSPYYDEAKLLMRFLYCFVDIDDKYVPDMSILKEFIGGSYFYSY
ncbi:MAG: nucleoside kinase [Fusobacteriaceae bacterium]